MTTNNPTQIGGEFMVQDMNHMVVTNRTTSTSKRKAVQQVDQSQTNHRQQGDDHGHKPRRQAH